MSFKGYEETIKIELFSSYVSKTILCWNRELQILGAKICTYIGYIITITSTFSKLICLYSGKKYEYAVKLSYGILFTSLRFFGPLSPKSFFMASKTIFFLFWRKAFSSSHSSMLYRKSAGAVLFKIGRKKDQVVERWNNWKKLLEKERYSACLEKLTRPWKERERGEESGTFITKYIIWVSTTLKGMDFWTLKIQTYGRRSGARLVCWTSDRAIVQSLFFWRRHFTLTVPPYPEDKRIPENR